MKRRMDCNSCGVIVFFEITNIPEDELPQATVEGYNYYCPVCSSAEFSVEVETEPVEETPA